ncbi:MAG: glycosyltransferase family 4 protein [Candidatus Marinimicrobia bacterium]|nr:glycosyltransferase family 4 protein [Candidatus Neomarinimicrobiota bacterium]
MKKKKILIVTNAYSTFVLRDVAILEKKYQVIRFTYKGKGDLPSNILAQLSLKIWLLRHIWTSYAVYVWFADYHAFLPVLFARIFRKKSFVVEGGYDTANLPEFNYGSHTSPLRSVLSTYAMKHANMNLPVSETLIPEILALAPNAQVQCLYTGFDETFFMPNGPKEKMVITVAGKISLQRIRIKGIDWFIESARAFPDIPFVIIGHGDGIKNYPETIPENVTITGMLSQEDLIYYYQKAMIYAQLSIREGLPTAVCEAMLCECVPVGFNAGGIPVAIGDAGLIIGDKTPEAIKKAINEALNKFEILGPLAREHVIKKFPQKLRESRLFDIIKD